MSVKILYIGGVWPSNIGNSFIDIGCIQSLKAACPDAEISTVGAFSNTLYPLYGKDMNYMFDLIDKIPCDYVVMSGPFNENKFVYARWRVISRLLKKNNAKLIINGMGGSTYTEKEYEGLTDFFFKHPPYAMIARDEETFIKYNGFMRNSHNGLDCGFFMSDCFTPDKLNMFPYVVHNFDKLQKTDILLSPFNIFMSTLKYRFGLNKGRYNNPVNKPGDYTEDNKLIVRTNHAFFPYISNKSFSEPNTLISGSPEDYINIYANAEAVYSCRVHACVAALAFGKPAKLFNNSPRAALLDRVGAKEIRKELTYPNTNLINALKSDHINFLSEIIK